MRTVGPWIGYASVALIIIAVIVLVRSRPVARSPRPTSRPGTTVDEANATNSKHIGVAVTIVIVLALGGCLASVVDSCSPTLNPCFPSEC